MQLSAVSSADPRECRGLSSIDVTITMPVLTAVVSTMTAANSNSRDLLTALARFETCLETPVIPGELPDWLASAQAHCHHLGDILRRQVSEKHSELLRQIVRQDAELARRVEKLKENDEALLAQQQDCCSMLDQLHVKADQVEPHEAKLHEQLEQVIERSIAFVIEVRKQETALTTWYMEAFDRDRGTAD